MSSKIRRHLRANLIAYLALFIGLGGTGAFAAQQLKKNSVKSKQIKDGGIKTQDLADGAVVAEKVGGGVVGPLVIGDGSITAAKLADGSIGSPKVADDGLTGADIDESTLSGVDADTVGGLRVKKINYQVPFGPSTQAVLEYPGIFRIDASCQTVGDVLDISAATGVNGSAVSVTAMDHIFANDTDGQRDIVSRSDPQVNVGDVFELDNTTEGFADSDMTVHFATPDGVVITTYLSANLTTGTPGGFACKLTGVSVGG